MTVRALAILIPDGQGNWSRVRWKARFARELPGRPVGLWGVDPVDPRAVAYAAVWKPPAGALAGFPDLRVIFNLGAGVDALVADPTLPRLPLVRAVSDDLTGRMSEYVLLHVLMIHRRQRLLDAAQRRGEWMAPDQWAAPAVRVGVMGLGVLGIDAVAKLKMVGFDVAGWSRSPKSVPGVRTFAGTFELAAFLARTDILVCLLPLTDETRGILDRRLFAGLARDGVLGGPYLINAGRGGLQAEDDILAALDDGTLAGATLDVFATEPLPAASRLWSHPAVTVTPHNAADSDPDVLARDVARQILAFERGEPLVNVVDRDVGY